MSLRVRDSDFDVACLFLCLFAFVDEAYKGWRGVRPFPSSFSSPFHHYHHHQLSTMSSPSPTYVAYPFLFREDTSAPDVVESMEEVGGPASLSLN